MCKHDAFHAETEVNRIDDGKHYQANVQVWCQICGKQFQFIGLPKGVNLNGPAMSADGKEARLAIEICKDSPSIM